MGRNESKKESGINWSRNVCIEGDRSKPRNGVNA